MPEPFDERTTRRQRLEHLRSQGLDPYPSTSGRTHTLAEVQTMFETLQQTQQSVTIVGRVRAVRQHGGSTFLTLDDGSATLQIYLTRDQLGPEEYRRLDDLDLGDFLEVRGRIFTTRKGERSVLVENGLRFLAKSLRPLPEKWHGLSDVEVRYRKRYLDLLVNEGIRANATLRSSMVRHLRQYLEERGFTEVETPVLQPIPGGATARPFVTHLNALDLDLYLRVAPELYLKRLLVGGFTKVFEVARCFRNEGMDHSHNPEFTQVELYQAYTDYRGLMTLLEGLLVTVVERTTGGLQLRFESHVLDFTPPYAVRDWTETLSQAMGGVNLEDMPDATLRRYLQEKGIEVTAEDGRGAMLDQAYKKFVRPTIVQPTFLIDHPLELSPLAKRHRHNPRRAERFQLVLGGGVELMNGFSELNDPLDQRARFEEQERLRAAGDDEAQPLDEDYLEALEHGMPPAAGVGVGLDRLAAVLTNSHSLKEIILFPTLRPRL